jgi:hypothetical protein
MKISRVLCIISLAANAALLLALRSTPSLQAPLVSDFVLQHADARASDSSIQGVPGQTESVDAGHGKRAGKGSLWKELQSDNPSVFIARLRAAGFPPRVVYAIVSSVVNERFLSQREDLMRDVPAAAFWKPPVNAFNDAEKMAALNKLNCERDDLMKLLLGADAGRDELQEVYLRRQYGDLPAEKMRKLQDVLSDYRDLRTQLQPPNEPVTANELEKLAALDREIRADLAKVLTPPELEQFDLRSSGAARKLRERLDAFRPNENEYRGIFQLTRGIEERYPLTGDVVDPKQMAARNAEEQQIEPQLRALLGADRYADYQQATNPEYRALNQIVSRFDLPLSAARDVVALQRDFLNRARAVSSNDAIPPVEKDAQLVALSREAFVRVGSALTPRGLEAYKRYGGNWLSSLAPAQAGARR